MLRGLVRFVFVTCLGAVALVVGLVAAIALAPPGRALLARLVPIGLAKVIHGSVEVGAVSGSFLYDLTLRRLVVRDTAGVLLADIPRARVSYRLPNLLAGRYVLASLTLDRPTLQLIRSRRGRFNYEDVLGLGRGPKGGPSPLVEFREVRIAGGVITVALPWNPSGLARTPQQKDSALAAERRVAGRIIEPGPEGLRRVIVAQDVDAHLPLLRVSSPDKGPLVVEIDSFATRLNDPAIAIRDAHGRLTVYRDSLAFSLARLRLPRSELAGGGAVTWPSDTLLFDAVLTAPRLALADVRFVNPNLPDWTGRAGTITATWETSRRTAYLLRDLDVGAGRERLAGDLVAVVETGKGLAVRDLRLDLTRVDLDAVRPFLDTLPFAGVLSGRVEAEGALTDLAARIDWRFEDASVPGMPATLVRGGGRISTGADGLVFGQFRVDAADLDLGTVRRFAPAVPLQGRLAASGVLDGALRNADFTGVLRHRDGALPESVAEGSFHLDTRGREVALRVDGRLEPLAFDGIRRAYPSLPTLGEVRGPVRIEGTLSRLAVDAALDGTFGSADVTGVLSLVPPRFAAESLGIRFADVDLAVLRGAGPATRLTGLLTVDGVVDTLRAPEGRLALDLAPGRARGLPFDSLHLRLAARDSLLLLDTLTAAWPGGTARGAGTLGWAAPKDGRLQIVLRADSLRPLNRLLDSITALAADTSRLSVPLQGTADGVLTVAGALDAPDLDLTLRARGLQYRRFRGPDLTFSGAWRAGERPTIIADFRSDSLAWGERFIRGVSVRASGFRDSLAWTLGAGLGPDARLETSGEYETTGGRELVRIGALRADLAGQEWMLARPAELELADTLPNITALRLRATDGTGLIDALGTVPSSRPGLLTVSALGVSLPGLYSLAQLDTTGIRGRVGLDVELGGTAQDPTLRGTLSLSDARAGGDVRLPLLQGVVNYADRRLESDLSLYRTGERVLEISAILPVDLAFEGAEKRLVEGPLLVQVTADSVDLSLMEALTRSVRNVRGTMRADVQLAGSWQDRVLSGSVQVQDARASIPALGVTYSGIGGTLDFARDSVVIRDFAMNAGGRLTLGGSVYFADSTLRVNVAAEADRFRAVDRNNFLRADVSGRLRYTGRALGGTLSGEVTADNGAYYFTDLLQKRVIDLDDPEIAEVIDTALVRRRGLGDAAQTRFLQELRIADLGVRLGEAFWLRSAEANIKLRGRVGVAKTTQGYRLDGTLNAERGNYTLRLPVTRDFQVDSGTVRYFGTPDLNAELNVAASTSVRAVRDNRPIQIIARIRGTLLTPRITFESPDRSIPEGDLLSYLVTGAPNAEASLVGGAQAVQVANTLLGGAVASELQRAVVSDLGIPLDMLRVQLPVLGTGASGIGAITQFAAGWQIGPRTFVTLNAGFCGRETIELTRNFGASVEYRLNRTWRAQASFEPALQTCAPNASVIIGARPYQVGLDIFWDREF